MGEMRYIVESRNTTYGDTGWLAGWWFVGAYSTVEAAQRVVESVKKQYGVEGATTVAYRITEWNGVGGFALAGPGGLR